MKARKIRKKRGRMNITAKQFETMLNNGEFDDAIKAVLEKEAGAPLIKDHKKMTKKRFRGQL